MLTTHVKSSMAFSLVGLGHETLGSVRGSQGWGRAPLWAFVNGRNKEAGIRGRKTERYAPTPTPLPAETTSKGFLKFVILSGRRGLCPLGVWCPRRWGLWVLTMTFHCQCPVLESACCPSAHKSRWWVGQTRWEPWKQRWPSVSQRLIWGLKS